jgi:hypothetical protein
MWRGKSSRSYNEASAVVVSYCHQVFSASRGGPARLFENTLIAHLQVDYREDLLRLSDASSPRRAR